MYTTFLAHSLHEIMNMYKMPEERTMLFRMNKKKDAKRVILKF